MQILDLVLSPNYDIRPNNEIKYIIIHYTELNFDESLERLCDEKAKVSAHYIINKKGEIFRLVDDIYRAWHAGKSKWREDEKLNDNSIGIELENLGNEKFEEAQIDSLVKLCLYLKTKYKINPENILGHSDIAPDRKIDPGVYLPWRRLLEFGIGIKFQTNYISKEIIIPLETEISKIQKMLKFIGYDIEITGVKDKKTNDVFRAFKLHFNPEYILRYERHILYDMDAELIWDENSLRILQNITPLSC